MIKQKYSNLYFTKYSCWQLGLMKISPSLPILLTGFSQKLKMFLPPYKGSAGLKVLPSNFSRAYTCYDDEKDTESQDVSNSRCDGLWEGEVFRDYSQGACQSVRGGDETPQDIGRAAITQQCLTLDQNRGPPLRRRQGSHVHTVLH